MHTGHLDTATHRDGGMVTSPVYESGDAGPTAKRTQDVFTIHSHQIITFSDMFQNIFLLVSVSKHLICCLYLIFMNNEYMYQPNPSLQ